jgi:hypothetical protein
MSLLRRNKSLLDQADIGLGVIGPERFDYLLKLLGVGRLF